MAAGNSKESARPAVGSSATAQAQQAPPERFELKTPTRDELVRGARWQVEGMPFPIVMRAMANVLGADLGTAVRDGWSTDYAYVLSMGACGDAFTFGLHVRSEGGAHEVFRRFPAARHENALRRGLDALRRHGEVLTKGAASWSNADAVKRSVATAIAVGGRPVLVVGLPLPEHIALVTGYEQGGDVLLGWSCEGGGPSILFERECRKQFTEWYAAADLIAFCKEPVDKREDARIYRQAVARGADLLRRQADGAYLTGQPLYEAWARAFAEAKDEASVQRARALIDPYVWDLAERRHYGREFLQKASEVLPEAATDLKAAADQFGAIHDLMWEVFRAAGGPWPGDPAPKVAEPAARQQIATLIRQAAALDQLAADLLALALTRLPAA